MWLSSLNNGIGHNLQIAERAVDCRGCFSFVTILVGLRCWFECCR